MDFSSCSRDWPVTSILLILSYHCTLGLNFGGILPSIYHISHCKIGVTLSWDGYMWNILRSICTLLPSSPATASDADSSWDLSAVGLSVWVLSGVDGLWYRGGYTTWSDAVFWFKLYDWASLQNTPPVKLMCIFSSAHRYKFPRSSLFLPLILVPMCQTSRPHIQLSQHQCNHAFQAYSLENV